MSFFYHRIATTRSFAIFGSYWPIFGNCGACSVNVPRVENLYQFSFEPCVDLLWRSKKTRERRVEGIRLKNLPPSSVSSSSSRRRHLRKKLQGINGKKRVRSQPVEGELESKGIHSNRCGHDVVIITRLPDVLLK